MYHITPRSWNILEAETSERFRESTCIELRTAIGWVKRAL